MKIHHSIAYLLNCLYSILDLEGEVHSIWDCWISGLRECKGNGSFEVGRAGNNCRSSTKKLDIVDGRLPLPKSTSPEKFVREEFNVPPNDVDGTDPLTMLQIIYNKYYIALITRKDIYMSSKNYKANGYGHDSNLITISH